MILIWPIRLTVVLMFLIQRASYGGRVVVPTKTGAAVPNSGRIEGTEARQRPANLKVFDKTSLSSARMMVVVEDRKTFQSF